MNVIADLLVPSERKYLDVLTAESVSLTRYLENAVFSFDVNKSIIGISRSLHDSRYLIKESER